MRKQHFYLRSSNAGQWIISNIRLYLTFEAIFRTTNAAAVVTAANTRNNDARDGSDLPVGGVTLGVDIGG